MVEIKIPGMAYTVQLFQRASDHFEVVILLHGKPEISSRSRLLEKGSIRRAISTGLRQIGVSISEMALDNIARELIEVAEKEGLLSEPEQAASVSSPLEEFKKSTDERLEQLETQLKDLVERVVRIEERLGL
ncbi:MAG: hypothetical protein ACFFCW_28465 [Candidatus Hodarchaeota archaeon]